MLMKFALKLILNGAIMSLLLYWYASITYTNALIVAVIFAVAAWIAGDQFILRAANNTVATIADGVMAILYLWIVSYILNLDLSFGEMLIISLIMGGAEWFFHRYVMSVDRVTLA